MFPALTLPFLRKPLPAQTPSEFQSIRYCIALDSMAVGWLHRRLLDAIRFQSDKVLVLDDINALAEAEGGPTIESNRALLVGGFSYSLQHLYELHGLLIDLDHDGGLLVVNGHEAHLLYGWLDHECDFIAVCPGRYPAMSGEPLAVIGRAFGEIALQIRAGVELCTWTDLGQVDTDTW